MKTFKAGMVCALCLVILGGAALADAVKPPKARRQHAVIYSIKANATSAQMARLRSQLSSRNAHVIRNIHDRVDMVGGTRQETEEAFAQAIMSTGAVDFAEPDYLEPPDAMPNDPSVNSQWFHARIGDPAAWDICTGSDSVIVAVCDTGIDSTHPDLAANLLLPGYNSVDGTTQTEPIYFHGTRVAGCVGAVGNNGVGVSGVCWKVKIMPIRITNRTDGAAYISDMAAGIRWAADHGAKVVNLSFGGVDSSTINSAAQYLRSKGGLLFMSAGNNGAEQPTFPDYAAIIAVGSVNSSDTHSSFSNYGTFVDIVAPGESIYSTAVGGGYASTSGTSFSSPIAAGVAALLFAANPALTNTEVEQAIYNTCDDLGQAGDDPVYGHGRVNAGAALASVSVSPNVPPTATAAATPCSGPAPLSVQFDGSASADSDGQIVSYVWDFGDGKTAVGAKVAHSYAAGDYTATLTVTDDRGATATSEADITATQAVVHDVAVVSIQSASSCNVGATLPIVVTVANRGNVTETFDLAVTETPDGNNFGASKIENLTAGEIRDAQFSWVTSDATVGAHTVSAEATPVTDETQISNNSFSKTVTITDSSAPTLELNGTGLFGKYFSNARLTGAMVTRTDPTIDFLWPNGVAPATGVSPKEYSVRWSGRIEPVDSGVVTFYLYAAGGCKLWVDGKLLVDDWRNNDPVERSGQISLQAGKKVEIVITYCRRKGDGSIKLSWSSESRARETVPQECLYPDGDILLPAKKTDRAHIRPSPFPFASSSGFISSRVELFALQARLLQVPQASAWPAPE